MLALIWTGVAAPLVALTHKAAAAAFSPGRSMVLARAEARVRRMADLRGALRGSSSQRRHKFDDQA